LNQDEIKVILENGTGELVEKKSRFIATCTSVNSTEEAEEQIKQAKKKYYDARHVCFAYIIEGNLNTLRCSDDGEPSGTAGKPMLDILEKEGVANALIICVRYFGGTLLGTGGLVRAYQGAAKIAFLDAKLGRKTKGLEVEIVCSYEDHGKVQYIIEQKELNIQNMIYLENVTTILHIPEDVFLELQKEVIERTSARAKIKKNKEVFLIEKI
jgi:uncharacterized YigZ family protein